MKKRLVQGGILAALSILIIVLGSRIKPVKQETVTEKEVRLPFKLGVILPSDETENDTKAHMDAIAGAAGDAGILPEQIVWKERTEEGAAASAAEELLGEDCTMILAANSCYAGEMAEFAAEYKDVSVVTVTDTAVAHQSENLSTIQLDTKKACYLAGVAAGSKLKALDEKNKIPKDFCQQDGRVKIGYVAKYDEELSGEEYGQFLRGVRLAFSKVTMEIRSTGVRYDPDAEASAADTLIRSGCILIATNAESGRVESVVEHAGENKRKIWFVGYHNEKPDGSVAEYAGIVKDWQSAYAQILTTAAAEKEIPTVIKQDYDDSAVTVFLTKKGVAEGTEERMENAGRAWSETKEMSGIYSY